MLTNCTVTDKDGKVKRLYLGRPEENYDRRKSRKRNSLGELHKINDSLGGTLRHVQISDSNGRHYKRIIIEYEEEKVMDAVIYSNGNQECERANNTFRKKSIFKYLYIN